MSASTEYDSILIDSLCIHTRIGCSPEERAFAQRLLVDLEISLDPERDFTTGDLGSTVCYANVCTAVSALAESQEWILLEDFAEAIFARLFAEHALAEKITLRLKKQIVERTHWTGVRISRARPRP